MSLKEKLDAYKAGFAKKVPARTREVMQKATEELRTSGIMEKTLKVGGLAPDFQLSDTGGNDVSLSSLLEKGPLVLTFFRGVW